MGQHSSGVCVVSSRGSFPTSPHRRALYARGRREGSEVLQLPGFLPANAARAWRQEPARGQTFPTRRRRERFRAEFRAALLARWQRKTTPCITRVASPRLI
jgi:hypothetical protein